MTGLINISNVAGSGPSFNLTVDTTAGAAINDHVSDNTGDVFRVTAVPDSTHIDVEDDVKPDAPEGTPVTGNGSVYTPTASLNLSQAPFGTPAWDEVARRDLRQIDAQRGKAHAQLSSSEDQVPADDNPVVITYNIQDDIDNITHSTTVNPGEITIEVAGAYFVMAQPQVGKDSGGTKKTFNMFMQVDRDGGGFVDEPNSNIKLTIKDADITDVIVSGVTWDFEIGDKFRFMQKVDSGTGLGLKNTDPVVGPPSIPRTPSIIFTMFRVSTG